MFIACSNLIARNPAALHNGIAVGDLDGDGRDEVLVAGQGGPNRLLKWDGERLVDLDLPTLADDGRPAIGVACADLDGDGREEVYIVNSDTPSGPKTVSDRLFACFGGRWFDLFAMPEHIRAANRIAGRSVVAIDRRGQGRYGFLVATAGGALRLYELDGRGKLVDAAEEAGLDAVTLARSVLAGPILGGDLPDLFVGTELGPNLLFRNLGDGVFEEVGAERGLDDPRSAARGVAMLDQDGDGLFDLVVGAWEGPNRLFQQRAGGGFRDIAPPELSLPGRVRTVIAADFDNDGYEELFFNMQGEPNRLFGWRDERWQEVEIGDAAEPRGSGTGAAVADLDGDGQLELIISHGEQTAQPLSLYLAEPRGHHWLRVRPLTRAGAPARGAKVTLMAGGRTQIRVIDGGSGYLCQMEPVAHFGLGAVRTVDRVEIVWPDGAIARIDRPSPCTTLSVPHPAR